jgi:hypothetical protein
MYCVRCRFISEFVTNPNGRKEVSPGSLANHVVKSDPSGSLPDASPRAHPNGDVADPPIPRDETKALESVVGPVFKKAETSLNFRRSEGLAAYLAAEPPDEGSNGHFRWRIATIVESLPAKSIVLGMIVINAVLVGIEADGLIDPNVYDHIDWGFTIFFCIEITMKLYGYWTHFW